ncbi:uncharacterized protein LOC129765872 [Toxorhynchites rutilus septentrionalis]|uniref:uncharacterized protein LOC129765872 n=1 Tax=Toxorhynchites rutilus septentrionalis TaxID=329112 RepID=UPI00247A5690|nr:uncharacterized protein LOC129765872 [Toxorhynchites rutilus septentrionalis]
MIADIEGVESFLDDLMVYSKTEKEHHEILTTLFQRLQEYGFILREEKCNLLQQQIKYLAHIVDASGLRPDPAKIESIIKMPPPNDITSLRSFLGAVNFYAKFVKEMHQLRRPLDALLKKNTTIFNQIYYLLITIRPWISLLQQMHLNQESELILCTNFLIALSKLLFMPPDLSLKLENYMDW